MRGYYPGEKEPDPEPSGAPEKNQLDGGMSTRRFDWIAGILLGILLGLAVISAFLVFGSENTIDAPSISGVDTGKPAQEAPAAPEAPAAAPEAPAAPPAHWSR